MHFQVFVSRASWSGGVPEVGAGPSPSPECLQQYVLLCCPSCDLEKHEGPAGLQRSARLASRAPPPGGSVVGGWLAMSFVQSNSWKPLLHSTTSARALPIRAPTTMRACSIRDASGNRVEYVWCGLLEAQRRVRRARCSQHTSSTATTCNCHATAAHRVCLTRSGLRANCSAA